MSKIYISEVLRIAAEEVGYLEKATNDRLDDKTANAGPGNWTKYARDLWEAQPHFYQSCKNGYDWCAVFADWCRYMAGGKDALHAQAISFQTGPYGASCNFAVRYYKQAGAWYAAPQPGDQIFFGSANGAQHTGLVERVEGGVVYTIEGNSGNAVRRRSYSLTDSSILGYGRPTTGKRSWRSCPSWTCRRTPGTATRWPGPGKTASPPASTRRTLLRAGQSPGQRWCRCCIRRGRGRRPRRPERCRNKRLRAVETPAPTRAGDERIIIFASDLQEIANHSQIFLTKAGRRGIVCRRKCE